MRETDLQIPHYKPFGLRFEFKLADMWVGVYWQKKRKAWIPELQRVVTRRDVWICFVPCMPLHVWW